MTIRPDDLYPVRMEQDGAEALEVGVNAKYDRVDFYRPLGIWMLKFYSDDGLMSIYTDEHNARRVAEAAELPIVERPFIFNSEHEGWIKAETGKLTDELFELDVDEAQILKELANETRED